MPTLAKQPSRIPAIATNLPSRKRLGGALLHVNVLAGNLLRASAMAGKSRMWDVTQKARGGKGEDPKGVFAHPDPENSGGTNLRS